MAFRPASSNCFSHHRSAKLQANRVQTVRSKDATHSLYDSAPEQLPNHINVYCRGSAAVKDVFISHIAKITWLFNLLAKSFHFFSRCEGIACCLSRTKRNFVRCSSACTKVEISPICLTYTDPGKNAPNILLIPPFCHFQPVFVCLGLGTSVANLRVRVID